MFFSVHFMTNQWKYSDADSKSVLRTNLLICAGLADFSIRFPWVLSLPVRRGVGKIASQQNSGTDNIRNPVSSDKNPSGSVFGTVPVDRIFLIQCAIGY